MLKAFFEAPLRTWRGQVPLGIVFWGYGVGASSVIAVLYATVLISEELALQQVLNTLSLLYTIWILVAIWRSSSNTASFWVDLARWLTVAWALNSAMVLLFLQFDLLARYSQG